MCSSDLKIIPGAIIVETDNTLDANYYFELGHVTQNDYLINDIKISSLEAYQNWIKTLKDIYPLNAQNQESTHVETLNYDSSMKFERANHNPLPKVCLPVFPGTNCEYDTKRAFEDEGAIGQFVIFKNNDENDVMHSITELVQTINESDILALSGGFSSGDEPAGSAKFIVNVLQTIELKQAISQLLARDGLIIGICNGFQALIKSGLLPYGEIKTLSKDDATLFRNDINRHISLMAHTKIVSNNSPWLQDLKLGDDHMIAMSHGEGKFVCDEATLNELIANGQVAFQYVDDNNNASNYPKYNPNCSVYAIEGITSKCGKVIGKMGHSERYTEDTFKNIYGNKKQNIFASGVNYIKGRK